MEFFYIFRDASFNCKVLLKLIHFKSFKMGVTWSRFKYFPLLATLAENLYIFYFTAVFTALASYGAIIVLMREDKGIYSKDP